MKWKKTLQMIEVHCEGEVGKVVTSGVIDLPGKTMADKMSYINKQDDSFVRFLLFEPRGCAQMAATLLLPPTTPEADVGSLVLLADGAHSMSGSNTMCAVTAMLETGILSMVEPVTELVLDTPAGLVKAKANCKDGKCEKVTLEMPPAFVERLDVQLDIDGFGVITGDVAYGGEYYVLLDVEQFDTTIEPKNARKLVRIGSAVRREFSERVAVRHPTVPDIKRIACVMFRGRGEDGALRTCTTGGTGRVDRSPCGTGNAANIAVLHEKGLLSMGESLVARSIIGSEFDVKLVDKTVVGSTPAVNTTVSGRSWVYGMHQLGLDPDDPFVDGFMLTDTWGDNIRT